eukprot:gene11474-9966_t
MPSSNSRTNDARMRARNVLVLCLIAGVAGLAVVYTRMVPATEEPSPFSRHLAMRDLVDHPHLVADEGLAALVRKIVAVDPPLAGPAHSPSVPMARDTKLVHPPPPPK